MEVLAFKEHWLVTIFGNIRLRSRLYRDKVGSTGLDTLYLQRSGAKGNALFEDGVTLILW